MVGQRINPSETSALTGYSCEEVPFRTTRTAYFLEKKK